MPKIVYLDCDGTLKNDKGEITKRTKEVIKRFIEKGNIIVLCTGRPRYHAEKISKEIECNDYLISSNGAEIYNNKNKTLINIISINNDDFIRIHKYAEKNNIRMIAVSEDKEYVTKEIRNASQILIPNSNEKIKVLLNKNKFKQIMLISKDKAKISLARKELIKESTSIIVLNESEKKNEAWITLGNSNVSKGNAVKTLTEYLGEDMCNTIAIGNDFNDISMFRIVGKSIAMGNSIDVIKEIVDEVIDSNNDDGVAIYLQEIIEKN